MHSLSSLRRSLPLMCASFLGLALSGLESADKPVGSQPANQSPLLSTQDSDHDGIPDNADSDPLIANYQSLKWEVTSVSLDYDVSYRMRVDSNSEVDKTNTKQVKGTFGWSLGGDGRIEAGARAEGKISGNPFELFGLRNTSAKLNAAVSVGGMASLRKDKITEESERESKRSFLSIKDETALGDLHLSFSVNVRNFSATPLVVKLAPIPVIVSGDDVADALPVNAGAESIEIPGNRPDGVLVKFRADIRSTKAFKLIRSLNAGESPTIDLARSRITIRAKNAPDEADLISSIKRIEAEDALVTVRTSVGSVSWRIARTQGIKPVTMREAFAAVNTMLKRESRVAQDFFEIGPAGIRSISGISTNGVWLVVDEDDAQRMDSHLLDSPVPPQLHIRLLERSPIAATAASVWQSNGAERKVLESVSSDFSLWKVGASEKWAEAEWLLGVCAWDGVMMATNQALGLQFFRASAERGYPPAQVGLAFAFASGRGGEKNKAEAVRWYRKAADQGDAKAQRIICDSCIGNLLQIDGAVQQWALENKKAAIDTYSLTDSTLLSYQKDSVLPFCPGGGTYSPGRNVEGRPRCSLAAEGHTL